MGRLPKRPDPVTHENAGRRIRDWLDEFNLTVKNIHDPDSDFFYIVTTDGGKKISISRNTNQFSDYIITPTLNAEETLRVMWEVEAMIGSIFCVGAMGQHGHNVGKRRRHKNDLFASASMVES